MRKLRELLRLKYEARLPQRAIAQACGAGLGSVTAYLQRATAAGLSWPVPDDLDNSALEARLFQQPALASDRAVPVWADLHQEPKRPGVTLAWLWQECRANHPDGDAYGQFCVRYRTWARAMKPSMRHVHRAGETAVEHLLKSQQDRLPPDEPPARLPLTHENVRGATYYEETPLLIHPTIEKLQALRLPAMAVGVGTGGWRVRQGRSVHSGPLLVLPTIPTFDQPIAVLEEKKRFIAEWVATKGPPSSKRGTPLARCRWMPIRLLRPPAGPKRVRNHCVNALVGCQRTHPHASCRAIRRNSARRTGFGHTPHRAELPRNRRHPTGARLDFSLAGRRERRDPGVNRFLVSRAEDGTPSAARGRRRSAPSPAVPRTSPTPAPAGYLAWRATPGSDCARVSDPRAPSRSLASPGGALRLPARARAPRSRRAVLLRATAGAAPTTCSRPADPSSLDAPAG